MATTKLENKPSITIIGCGNMGSAMARGLAPYATLYFYDRNPGKIEILTKDNLGIACKDIDEALSKGDIVILAIKPQNIQEIAPLINKTSKTQGILISLLTGIDLSSLKKMFAHFKVLRMMPNLAVQYGEGVIGISSNEVINAEFKIYIDDIVKPLGKAYWLPENKIDALTSLTGSGPAFMLTIIEAMVEAGIFLGFNASDSTDLVIQMIKGSLSLIQESAKHPGELKWQVTSPSGTTIAGIRRLEEGALRHAIFNAFHSAYERALELNSNSQNL